MIPDIVRPSVHRPRGPIALAFAVALAGALLVAAPAPTTAQQDDEPMLEQVRDVFQSEGLELGFLLQAVGDPGIDDDPARFTVGNARLRLQGQLDAGFGYKLQTNHVGTSTLLDAQVTWSPGPELTVAAGRFKTPFSREFLTYAGSIDFVNRSRVVSALAPNRQVGVQLGGELTEMVSWSAGGFTGATNATSDESLIGVVRVEGSGIDVGDDGVLAVAASFAGGREDAIGARQLGPAFAGDGFLYGADARFESGPLMLSGEYLRGEWEPDLGADVDSEGLYLTAGYMVQEARQILLRWDRYEAPGAIEADDALVFGFNAWPTTATEIQINWLVPLKDSNELHKLLINFQVGI